MEPGYQLALQIPRELASVVIEDLPVDSLTGDHIR
jgi:hypothetical protein